ncbi:3-oxoacyl-[acyl-carrier-protein] reductase [Thermosulfuriphilus ammonigenes]|uniref:3-oxoacyl-[acyl-carrier-protein] reductase n=1 Tax=Thermosulfuriphilus ammonigenes TaxID=1936021 RepID=A0A6G7PWX3_9BACT|nr:3-oxoacyl-[acyl-carrier-protein] reductase [Thermosulfuriphilus ammonigenes]MBA2849713.1 3-oxoacyl-[acyl-carrier protein] reductase [Thermosulfuriphilus ammonigenes]QIJ72195.1 3-oxoacyl-[acyl-carrier-protein] reductase [Thermosulfuriphilus ammonigenes]
MKTLQNAVAIVTGGSRGIGRAIAERLAQEGAKVYLTCASRPESGEEVAEAIRVAGGQAEVLVFDVSDFKATEEALKEVLSKEGQVDILVNNAGLTRDGLLMRLKEEDWDRVLGVNLKGAFNCCRVVVPAMLKRRRGRIINISSVVGVSGNVGQTNYAASKAGLIGFSKSLAREVASRGVTVNVVAPGFIETDMTAALPEKIRKDLLAQIPVGRYGRPEEVAAVVSFLASDEAAYITGQVIHINGGLYM